MLVMALLITTGCKSNDSSRGKENSSVPLEEARKGELTKDLAVKILNQCFSEEYITSLNFSDGGFDRAVRDQIIQGQNGEYRFTDSGIALVGNGNKIVVPHFSQETPYIALKRYIGLQVSTVNSIEDGSTPKRKSVDYVVSYVFPQQMRPITKYVFEGARWRSSFVKDSDGWSVSTTMK